MGDLRIFREILQALIREDHSNEDWNMKSGDVNIRTLCIISRMVATQIEMYYIQMYPNIQRRQ